MTGFLKRHKQNFVYNFPLTHHGLRETKLIIGYVVNFSPYFLIMEYSYLEF